MNQEETNTVEKYDHKAVEKKWSGEWDRIRLNVTNIGKAQKPFYNLMMFPYPSAEGLHVGNMYAFTGTDVYGRFKRLQGYDVFEPIGLDGFGIHSENFALKIGRHPMDHATVTEKNFYIQLHKIGAMYDWTRTVETYHPDYYQWTQWLFVQMFKHGLAYRGKAEVNWCPGCKTVLSDEQVIPASPAGRDGLCERCGNSVERRLLEQWFFKITAYAEKLLENLSGMDWTEKVKVAQKNWIGKKTGINITYEIFDDKKEKVGDIVCFTTTPVNFAATFLVLAPEHPFINQVSTVIDAARIAEITKYQKETKMKSPQDRTAEGKKKTGVFTGLYAKNHVTGDMMPVWISDFVLANVGTGAIQACPGHDKRDFQFAQAFGLPIIRVVVGEDGNTSDIINEDQVIEHGPGTMVNSGFLDGMSFDDAMEKTKDYFEEKGWGKPVTTYHLRDWLLSRQRYWGPPIPMIYCDVCAKKSKGERGDMPGWWTVPESQLPVVLPRIEDYKPAGDGVPPLAKHKEFYEVLCPACGAAARRETEVSDTFLDSSWYFLRYPSVDADNASFASSNSRVLRSSADASAPSAQGSNLPKLTPHKSSAMNHEQSTMNQSPWDPAITKQWLPVHMYTGGAEHSVLHLMYSRFITMALHDWGYIDFEEPFQKFFAHGLVIKDGAKMSKSKGNVVNPDDYIETYGADALRLYLMFMGPFSQGGDFRDSAMEGMSRWVGRIWRMVNTTIVNCQLLIVNKKSNQQSSIHNHQSTIINPPPSSAKVHAGLQKVIKKVTDDIERRHYNTAIAAMMEFTNLAGDENNQLSVDDAKTFVILLAPFAPHLSEELWQRLNGAMTTDRLPVANKQNDPSSLDIGHLSFSISTSVHMQSWPTFDASAILEDMVQIVVQVNGKVRDTLEVKSEKSLPRRQAGKVKEEVENLATASEKVQKFLDGKQIKKVIFIPNKIINFVVS